ncbi:hypothetical protein CLV28_0154 [Sediminihabitans luteus]|uniref:Uncharacterized protein n=1 Tax=Sediminihabitans luteus TaxID=1138585 RepID=A0A2M9CYD1_9CELL|nr:hypothetical protein [Sediminihabitans luteus]PJJ76942.1 hypothetical protein CLV28_0154 [Sediminihabitans luteus]
MSTAGPVLHQVVLLELPASAAAVDRDVETLPPPARVAWWREHGWAVPAGLTVLGLVYQWLAGHQGWTVPGWVPAVTTVLVGLTALASLVTYATQLRGRRAARGRAALLADPVRATGTLHLATEPEVTRTGVVLTGTCTYTRTPAPDDDEDAPLVRTVRFTHTVRDADGGAVVDLLPRRRVVEPVAVWYAARPDAEDVVLVRYARRWADDVIASLVASAPDPHDEPDPHDVPDPGGQDPSGTQDPPGTQS